MTTYSLRRQALVPLAGIFGLIVAFGAPTLTATAQEGDKILYLTLVDQNGKSVTDLKTDEVLIRETDGEREVVNVVRSTAPLAIVLLADTTKQAGATGMMSSQTSQTGAAELIRDIRVAIGSFAKDVSSASPGTEMEIMEFGQAAVPVTKMTSNLADIEKGVTRLFPKPGAASVLLEAIIEASKELSKTKSPRRVMVSLNIEPGDEQSRQQMKQLGEELLKSRASLWSVSLQVGQQKNAVRGLALDQLTKDTGGRREFIQSQAGLEVVMKSFADNLLQQYEVHYKRPAGAKPTRVAVGVKRDGLKLYASGIPPQ
ncbi:MAG TPA: hypothetical protein VMZ90_09740 [Vicinamibacterales bacterium]|nr:hypothetical protein [Vicinamibacterales bacterium]